MTTKYALDELVTRAELARRLGVSGERVRQLAERPHFPAPLGRVGQALVWRWADIEQWAKQRGRTIAAPAGAHDSAAR